MNARGQKHRVSTDSSPDLSSRRSRDYTQVFPAEGWRASRASFNRKPKTAQAVGGGCYTHSAVPMSRPWALFDQMKLPSFLALNASDRAIGRFHVGLSIKDYPDGKTPRLVASSDLNARDGLATGPLASRHSFRRAPYLRPTVLNFTTAPDPNEQRTLVVRLMRPAEQGRRRCVSSKMGCRSMPAGLHTRAESK